MLLRRCFGMTKPNPPPKKLNSPIVQREQISKLEYIPNELLIMIFEYLSCPDIICGFYKLNSRFQFLLHSYEYYYLDLSQEIKKLKFDLIQRLPLRIEQIKSLTLLNNVYSYIDVDQCLSIYPIELYYPKLQLLSLIDKDYDTRLFDKDHDKRLISFLFLLPNFQQLKCLLISSRYFKLYDNDTAIRTRDIILFEIRTLKYFTWDVDTSFLYGEMTTSLTQKSNIEHFEFHSMNFDELVWLKLHTVNMKSINIHNPDFSSSSRRQESFETLISIKLNNIKAVEHSAFLSEHVTCLTHLQRLELQDHYHDTVHYIDGYKWKDFIENYIPQLSIFKFFFRGIGTVGSRTLDELIESFMTDFWLKQKKWFITCYSNLVDRTYIYTVPCIQNNFIYDNSWYRKSTIAIDDTINIRELTLSFIRTKDIIPNYRFSNVRTLIIPIHTDVTYEQLNQVLNFSSIKHIEFKGHSKIFFDILEYNSTQISIKIDYRNLREILSRTTSDQIIYQFKKIRRLTIENTRTRMFPKHNPTIKINNICYLLLNIKELIIEEYVKLSELIYLLNHLKHLSFLSVLCYNLSKIGNDNIRQWLINQRKTGLKKKNFVYKWFRSTFRIWIE